MSETGTCTDAKTLLEMTCEELSKQLAAERESKAQILKYLDQERMRAESAEAKLRITEPISQIAKNIFSVSLQANSQALAVDMITRAIEPLRQAIIATEAVRLEETRRANAAESELYQRTQWLNNADRKLESLGYRRCDIPACNCSSYHDTRR